MNMRQLTHNCMKDPCFYKVLEILVGKVRLYEPCLFFKHPSNNVDDVIIEGYPCHLPISISYQHIVGNVPYEREESVILYVVLFRAGAAACVLPIRPAFRNTSCVVSFHVIIFEKKFVKFVSGYCSFCEMKMAYL